jgi:enterobactin synthetase component D / holo-[acyl-carrier protein] synthase
MTPIPEEPIATSPFEAPVAYVVHAQEADALGPQAGTRRRAEFTLGRAAAATALVQLGLDPLPPILRGPQGETMWPDGVIGSISHCCGWAVAVATTQPPCIAIGVDIERISDVAGLDGRPVCTPRELRWSDERVTPQARWRSPAGLGSLNSARVQYKSVESPSSPGTRQETP